MQVRGVSQMVETGQESARAAVSLAPLSADDAGVNNDRLNEIRLQESLIHDWFLLVTVGFCHATRPTGCRRVRILYLHEKNTRKVA